VRQIIVCVIIVCWVLFGVSDAFAAYRDSHIDLYLSRFGERGILAADIRSGDAPCNVYPLRRDVYHAPVGRMIGAIQVSTYCFTTEGSGEWGVIDIYQNGGWIENWVVFSAPEDNVVDYYWELPANVSAVGIRPKASASVINQIRLSDVIASAYRHVGK